MRIIKTDTRARIVVDLQPARKIKFIVPQLFNGSRDKINNNFGISNCVRVSILPFHGFHPLSTRDEMIELISVIKF